MSERPEDRFLYFDPFNGVSGDMILGALIDLGVPVSFLNAQLGKLSLTDLEIEASRVERSGLFGVDASVRFNPAESSGHRHLKQIRELVSQSELDEWVKRKALDIFQRLGEAEAKVHGCDIESVHFHEVGAVDSIVDVVGACLGFHFLGVSDFYTAPIQVGKGTVQFSHGTWPVPAPATIELLREFPVGMGGVEFELTTPTGAAIVTTLANPGSPPVCLYEQSGYGAGDKVLAEVPNMLRILLARQVSKNSSPGLEQVAVLETAMDDATPETISYLSELALTKGALDVYRVPLQMKKGRTGLLVTILCRIADEEAMVELLFRETTTLGVRRRHEERWVLEREFVEVKLPEGKVAVKLGRLSGQVVNIAPEFDDVKRVANSCGRPFKQVQEAVLQQVWALYEPVSKL